MAKYIAESLLLRFLNVVGFRCETNYDFAQHPIDDIIDPCLGLKCRAGFVMTPTDDGCRCMMTQHWGLGVEAASADKVKRLRNALV